MSDFDSVARTWDENPIHMERSKAIASRMEEMLPLKNGMKALEYGAGTGILSFLLHEKLGSVTMMDSSAEMVKVMGEKVLQRNTANLFPICFNLEKELSDQSYNLIFNQMVLHHIVNIQSLFERFYNMLLPGGFLAIADLYPEDGSFHGEGFDGHKGFDPEQLKVQLQKTGFKEVSYGECYTVKRMLPGGDTQSFPVFLLTASK
jgi:ubiquinone/menaquinone biosynthesis C-methylase UbiE